MPKTPTNEYCHFNEVQVRQSGLLTPSRMAEVEAQVTARIEPCFDKHGIEIPDVKIANLGENNRLVFSGVSSESTADFLRRHVLSAVLTSEELARINASAFEAVEEAKDKEHFAKAEKLHAWSGGVFFKDNYFLWMEELFDYLEREGLPWPEYVWATESQVVIPELDVSDVIEHYVLDRGWPDMDTHELEGMRELKEALDRFTSANSGVVCYRPDFSKAILPSEWKASSKAMPANSN